MVGRSFGKVLNKMKDRFVRIKILRIAFQNSAISKPYDNFHRLHGDPLGLRSQRNSSLSHPHNRAPHYDAFSDKPKVDYTLSTTCEQGVFNVARLQLLRELLSFSI